MRKQETMTIYTVECYKAYRMDEQYAGVFSLMPWDGDNEYYEGDDDGGEEYLIPDGYEVAEDATGMLRLYDSQGKDHDIIGKKHPAFYDNHGNIIRLAKTNSAEVSRG
jgi:hypothetical protein